MALRVLVIDDDSRLFTLLAEFLGNNDVHSVHAADGPSGLRLLAEGGFDAVFLDVMMPGPDGLSVLRKIRERSAVPVLMLTAKGDETDRVVGLELGADDYLPKPFSPRELLARLRAVLRRGMSSPDSKGLLVGGLELSEAERQARVGETRLDLTTIEFDLLFVLAKRTSRVVPRNALLELAGRADVNVSERTVDVHISRIRKKIQDCGPHGVGIKTIRGVGYQLVVGAKESS
jgi:two-component system, OmpR family, response regulator